MDEIYDNKIKNEIYYLSALGFMLLSLPFTIFGGLIPIISNDLGVSAHFIGIVLSLSAFSNFIAVIVAGNLIELFGIKKVLIIGIIFEIIGMVMINFTRSSISFAVFYLLSGVGLGCLGVSFNSLVSTTFKNGRSKRLLFLGIANFIGVIIGALFIKIFLLMGINWRYEFLTVGILFAGMLLAIIKLDLLTFSVSSNYTIRTFLQMHKVMILNKNLLVIGIIAFLFNGVASVFINWFTTYFKSFDIPVEISSLFIVFYAVSMIAGMLLKIFLLKFLKEVQIMIINSSIVFACFLGLIFFNNLIIKIVLIIIIGMNAAGIFMLCAAIAMDISKKKLSIVLGYIYASAYGGNIFLLYISGLAVDRFPKLGVISMCSIGWAAIFILSVLSLKIGSRSKEQELANNG